MWQLVYLKSSIQRTIVPLQIDDITKRDEARMKAKVIFEERVSSGDLDKSGGSPKLVWTEKL